MKLNVTPIGVDMILQCLEGGPSLRFSSLVLGNGTDAGTSAYEMSNPLQTIPISAIDREDGSEFVKLTGILSNANVIARFRATELGVMAVNPDNEDEHILFAYGYTPENEASVIPSVTDYAFETTQNVFVYVGKTEDVTAILSESIATVSRAEFRQHKEDNGNPHKVNAEQVGLGNVPNVTTDKQKPTIEYLPLKYTGYYSDLENIDLETIDPSNGDELRTILSKICSATKVALRHIANNDNPHFTTYKHVEAPELNHMHSADDISSGILPVARGGTGCVSYSVLASNLMTYLSVPWFGFYSGDGTQKRKIGLHFTPKAVLVVHEKYMFGEGSRGVFGGIAIGSFGVAGYNSSHDYSFNWNNDHTAIMITNNGFYVNYAAVNQIFTNSALNSYRYIAWR